MSSKGQGTPCNLAFALSLVTFWDAQEAENEFARPGDNLKHNHPYNIPIGRWGITAELLPEYPLNRNK